MGNYHWTEGAVSMEASLILKGFTPMFELP